MKRKYSKNDTAHDEVNPIALTVVKDKIPFDKSRRVHPFSSKLSKNETVY